MNEQGLAQTMGRRQGPNMGMVQQVASALMNGATPEELIGQGVPEDVVMMAMELIKQQQVAETGVPAEQAGLAGMVTDRRSLMER